jgi:uncharacterized membrane protein
LKEVSHEQGRLFQRIYYRLRGLPERERQNILSVYEELFQKAAQNGKHEDEIAESLGYPRIPQWDGSREQQPHSETDYSSNRSTSEQHPMANLYTNTNPNQGHREPYPHPYAVKPETGLKAIIASIALGFFNLVLVLGPFIAICGIIFALYVTSAACLLSPLVMIIGESWMGSWADMQFVFFSALAVHGFGILLTGFTVWFSKIFFKLTGYYIRFNMKIIKGA